MASFYWGLCDRCIVGELIHIWGVSELSLPICFLWHLAGCHLICYRSSELACRPHSCLWPTLQISKGRYKPSLHRSRAQPLRGYASVKRGVRFVKLSSKNASMIDVCSFYLCAYSNATQWTSRGRGKHNRKIRNVALLLCLECLSIHCENLGEEDQCNICCLH